jgi:hypothetical protein
MRWRLSSHNEPPLLGSVLCGNVSFLSGYDLVLDLVINRLADKFASCPQVIPPPFKMQSSHMTPCDAPLVR